MAVNLSPVGGVAAQFFNNDGTPLLIQRLPETFPIQIL